MPLVSVVVPVYNAADTLGEAVASVLAQTLDDWELVIVDDGSTDESFAVASAFDDPRLRIVRQANRGLAGARNAGIRASTGSLVAFLDADDTWRPEKLARHAAAFTADDRLGLSFDRSLLVDASGRSLATVQGTPGPASAEALMLDNPVGNGSAAVVRRAALDRLDDAFDEALCAAEDVDLWWRIVLATPFTAAGLPDVLTAYRQRPHSFSLDTERMRLGWEAAIAKARRLAPEVVARVERPARARMLRYLAGRAVAARDGRTAARLLRAALNEDAALLRAQPRQVATTAAAALAVRLLPERALASTERLARRVAGPGGRDC